MRSKWKSKRLSDTLGASGSGALSFGAFDFQHKCLLCNVLAAPAPRD